MAMYTGNPLLKSVVSLDKGRGSSDVVPVQRVVTKSGVLFAVLVAVGAVGWQMGTHLKSGLSVGISLGALVTSLVVGFLLAKPRSITVPLAFIYTIAQGLYLGILSELFNASPKYHGIVVEAVLATLSVFAGVLLLYKTRVLRVTSRSRRIFGYMMLGYLLFGLVNLVLVWTGVLGGFGVGGSGAIGIGLSIFGVAMASYSLAVDFDSIERFSASGQSEDKFEWMLAAGLVASIAWLYVELLRLFGRLRD